MKKLTLALAAVTASFLISTNAMALGTIGVAVEAADLGNGAAIAMPGVKASFEVFSPMPSQSLRAAVGYYTLSGTYNITQGGTTVPVNVSATNLQYGLVYNMDLMLFDLYGQAGFDNLAINTNGSFGGFTGAQNVSTNSMYYGAGLNIKPLPFITVGADIRFVNGLFGANRSDSIYTASLNLNF